MKGWKPWRPVVVAFALLALAGACSPAETPTGETGEVRVRFGYLLADLHHISHVVAQDEQAGGGTSIYAQHGLLVEDALGAPYANGGVEMDHFATGDVDIGLMGAPPAITKHLNAGIDTTIVGQVNEIGSALVVAQDVDRFSDLVGRVVATPGHSTIQFFLLLNYAQQQGVDVSQINVIDVAPKDMRAKLEAGDLAAFLAWEPFASEAVVAGFGKMLATSQDIWPDHLDCVVVVDRGFSEVHPEVVTRYLRAHQQATDWVLAALERPTSPEYRHLVDLAVEFTGREPAVVEAAFDLIHYKTTLDAGFSAALREYTRKLIEFNIIDSARLSQWGYASVDDFVATYVDRSFQQQARR